MRASRIQILIKNIAMPAQILVDLGKLKTFYSGLGQFSYYFGKNLVGVKEEAMQWNFLTPVSYYNAFGASVRYEMLSMKRRYLPAMCPDYDLWHAIHQDSAYFPGNLKTRYILTIHDLNFLREKSSFRVKMRLANLQRKIDRASYVTFISNFTESEVKKYLHLGDKPTRVIHNGVEIDTEKKVPRPDFLPEGKFLFSLGMILEKKNFHVLIDFMEKQKDYNLVIAGDKSFSYARKLERNIHRKKLSARIFMPGIISQEDKIWLFRNCEAFLFPSLNEGFGLPVIEAMRFGKPVFLSRYSSLPEIGGDLAFYWDSFEPNEMKDLFEEKFKQFENNKEALSTKLKQYSLNYSWRKSIHSYNDVYRELISEYKLMDQVRESTGPLRETAGKPMRVLHLSSEKGWRGGEQQIAYLVNELNRLGIDNRVGCEKNSRFEELCVKNKWKYFTSGFSSSLNLVTAARVAKLCRENNIDILHLHTSKSHTVGVISTLFGHHSKLILTRRVDNRIGRNFLSRWKYNHPRIKRIITVSDKIREVVTPVLSQQAKCVTIHSGIDTSRFNPGHDKKILRELMHASPGEILIGNTSALAAHKDYYTFVKTCEWAVNNGLRAKFGIIGEGPEEHNIRRYIRSKHLEECIIMTGFRNDISQLLPAMDIFLMTSVTEGLGTSILDAFAAGVPVVATRAGGIPEMVIHGQTGLLANPGDFKTLGEHLLRLISEPDLREKLVTNASRLLQEEYTMEIMAGKVLKIYQEVLR